MKMILVLSSVMSDGLTHWGRVTHICVSKLTIIDSYNGLSPSRRQAIIWTNAGILSTGPLGMNFSEILIEIDIFSFKKMRLKMSSVKWRPSCLGLSIGDDLWICGWKNLLPKTKQSEREAHQRCRRIIYGFGGACIMKNIRSVWQCTTIWFSLVAIWGSSHKIPASNGSLQTCWLAITYPCPWSLIWFCWGQSGNVSGLLIITMEHKFVSGLAPVPLTSFRSNLKFNQNYGAL